MRRLIAFAVLVSLSGNVLADEGGQLVENVSSRKDPTQTYTLYLPSQYEASGARNYPLLLIFDPRGRGTKAAEIFRPAAEEHGWILISSNDTRSDERPDRNERALQALIPEISRYPVDPKRIYATGFSGTALVAYSLGIRWKGLAGVIGVGGRFVADIPPSKFNFAHYGFAGSLDFNNREMRKVDRELDKGVVPHRFQQFEGTHEWIRPEHAREALGWFEVLAGNEGIRARVMAEDLAAAGKLTGLEALRRYQAIQRTYGGVEEQIARIDAAAELADEAKWDEWAVQYESGVFARSASIFASLRAEEFPTPDHVARAFRVKDLRRRTSRPGAEGAISRQLLEAAYAQMAYYLPPQLFKNGEYSLAAAVLGAAVEIHADRWDVWYNLGAARARVGSRKTALQALEKAIALGFRDARHLQGDEDFAALRSDKRFQELVEVASKSQ